MIASQLLCLATAIYHEAGNQTFEGMLAVGNVIMNRVDDDRYPDNPCDVTKQGEYHLYSKQPRRYECQFTFWCDGKPERIPEGDAAPWVAAVTAYSKIFDLTGGATHYHAKYVKPKWANVNRMTASIGMHLFYKL